MTNAEFDSLYTAARKEWPRVQLSFLRDIRKVYIQAADDAAAVVRATEAAGLSDLTSSGWQAIERQLREGAQRISQAVENGMPGMITDSYFLTESTPGPGRIDAQYLSEAVASVGGVRAITPDGLSNLYNSINNRLITALFSQEWADGYTFSERVWVGLNQQYQADIKRVIQAGIAQGRDVIDIARDIEFYARNGREQTFSPGRYGKLKPGTREYSARVGKAIDYRALRLARSELYSAMQTAAAWQGQSNPACPDLYDWLLNGGRQEWPCVCPDNASGSPYTYVQLPGFPHPNCFQEGTMVLTPHGEKSIENVRPGDFVITHTGDTRRVLVSWKTKHSGPINIIKTKESSICCTNNHPFLSSGKWVSARFLKNGDNLARISINVKPLPFIESESDDSPSRCLKEGCFFSIILLFSRAGVPIPTVNFNSELFLLKGHVDIEGEYGEIRERFLSEFYEGFIHHSFIGRPDLSGPELRAFDFLFIRHDAVSSCFIRSLGVRNPSVFISALKRFATRERFESVHDEVSVNARSRDPESFGYLVDREIFFAKKPFNNTSVKINPYTHNTSIVNVSQKKVNQYVYNLTVEEDHSYIANGFVVHNCGCTVRPRLMSHREFMADLTEWADGQSVPYLDDWYLKYYLPAQD